MRAAKNLNGIILRGKAIRVEQSRDGMVPEMRGMNTEEQKLMDDWSENHAYNRFDGSRSEPNFKNQPCPYVKIDQLPPGLQTISYGLEI